MNPDKAKYPFLDIAKLFFSICVIGIHTFPAEYVSSTGGHFLSRIYETVIRIAVPFFFMSSAFLTQNYNGQNNKFKKLSIKMFKLYIIWSIVYLPIAIIGYFQARTGFVHSATSYLLRLIFEGTHSFSYQLWYLLSAAYFSLLIHFVTCKGFMSEIHLLLISLAVYLASYYATGSTIVGYGRIFTGFFFLCWGLCVSKYDILKHIKPWLLITLFVITFALSVHTDNVISKLALYCISFLLAIRIRIPDSNIYFYFRKVSSIIYFVHMLVFFAITRPLSNGSIYSLKNFIDTTVVSLILSVVIISIRPIRQSKYFKTLFG